MNQELQGVQTGFRKGRGARVQIAYIHWIIEKAREFQKNINFYFINYTKKPLTLWNTKTVANSQRNWNTRPLYLSPEKPIYQSRSDS